MSNDIIAQKDLIFPSNNELETHSPRRAARRGKSFNEPYKQFCREHGCVYATPVIAIKNKLKSFEKIKNSVAFFDGTISLTPPQLPTNQELFDKQVEDFSEKGKQIASGA